MSGSVAKILTLFFSVFAAPVPHLGAMGLFPGSGQRALWAAGDAFRAGDAAQAAAALDPWLSRSVQAAREDLALHFLSQDYAGVLALDLAYPSAANDDEAKLWVARSDAALARWQACLLRLGTLAVPRRPWALSLRAEALAAVRDPTAPDAFSEALSATAGSRLDAMTALMAADLAQAHGDDVAAEMCIRDSQRADPSYSLVNLRLAELYLCQQRWLDARLMLERARRVDPRTLEAQQDLNALLQDQPGQREAVQVGAEDRLGHFVLKFNPRVLPTVLRKGEPLVRVGLLTRAGAMKFSLGGDMVDDARGLTLSASSAWVACTGLNGTWTLAPLGPNAAGASVLAGPLRLRPLDPATTFGLFGVEHGTGYFFAGSGDRYYRGLLEISARSGGLLVVNELGMEAYLSSVVPSEVPSSWAPDALRAQAIAARTEAWASLGNYKDEGYDLCPTVACAVYSGVGVENVRSTAAVMATAGIVLERQGGGLASAHYMDNSGGHTLSGADVWTDPESDSVGIEDFPANAEATRKLFPLSPAGLLHYIDDLDGDVGGWSSDEGPSIWRWTLRLTPEELASSVDRRHKVGRPRTVLGLMRSPAGYLENARIVGDDGDFVAFGDRIRSALKGLKSNLFYVESRLDGQGRTVALLFHG